MPTDTHHSTIDPEVEALLAEHAFYQVHLRMMLRSGAVQQAMADYEITRRHVQAEDVDIVTQMGAISRAQNVLVQSCKAALAPYPNLQARMNDSHLQLVLVDALCALLRGNH